MPIKIFRTSLVSGLYLIMASGAAYAADAQTLYTQSLAATCANCHGTQGKSLKDASVPGLAGRPSAYLIEQMQAFKAGTREATIMHQIAKGYTDEQVKQMADYFANQKP
jgi:cytochrome c553